MSAAAREIARALLTEAHALGLALVTRFESGTFRGYEVVSFPRHVDEKEERRAMAFEGTRKITAAAVGMSAVGANKTECVAVLIEVLPEQGEGSGNSYTWKGWTNSQENVERTIESLRAMGWKGSSFASLRDGKLDGLGSAPALGVFTKTHNPNANDGKGKDFQEVSFIRRIPTLKVEGDVNASALDAKYGKLLAPAGEDPFA